MGTAASPEGFTSSQAPQNFTLLNQKLLKAFAFAENYPFPVNNESMSTPANRAGFKPVAIEPLSDALQGRWGRMIP